MSVEKIIGLIPGLSQQELKLVLAAVDTELGKRSNIDISLYGLLWEVVGEKPIPIGRFSVSNNGILWRKNITKLHDLVEKIVGVRVVKRPVLHALHKFLFELLIDDLKKRDYPIPVTLKNVCSELGNIQAIFDSAFPGYLKDGLGHMILAKIGG